MAEVGTLAELELAIEASDFYLLDRGMVEKAEVARLLREEGVDKTGGDELRTLGKELVEGGEIIGEVSKLEME